MSERVQLGEVREGKQRGISKPKRSQKSDSYPQVFPLVEVSRWAMGTQKEPSPIFYSWGHPLPCTPPPSWIANILITSPILKSAGQAIIQALLMTPSAKVSIRQVGIRRAENRAGRRAEHKFVLV